tara:strand:+ start:2510 stop:2767 length:258 start_codon:yes stop_codon:yes gene_type:complete
MPVDGPAQLLGIENGVQQDFLFRPFRRGLAYADLREEAAGLAVLAGEEQGAAAAGLDECVFYLGDVLVPRLGGEGLTEIAADSGK